MDTWEQQVASAVQACREEIEGDLLLARKEQDRAVMNLETAQSRVAFLNHALTLVDDGGAAPTEKITLHEAMRRVLQRAPNRMMRAADLAETINRERLYRMQDGRSVEKQQVHARVGHYPGLFAREGTFIKLV